MHELYELKEKLTDELKEYSMKGDLSTADLEIVDKLAHTVKNLCKICEEMDGYSERYYGEGSYYREGGSGGGSYRGDNSRGGSYARRNYRRDSMGRYARDNEMSDKLRELMESAPDEKTRVEIQRLIAKLDQM